MTKKDHFFIHKSSYVDKSTVIGIGSSIWHFVTIQNNSFIGKNCIIGQNVMIGSDVTIGNNCKIQNNVSIYKGVSLEDGVFCGPSCVFTNVLNPRSEIEKKSEFKRTFVKKGATIGANATIICGITLGQYSLIGAGAVVTKDVKDFALMIGNPAKQVGWVSKFGEKLNEKLICPKTGEKFKLRDNKLSIL